MPFTLLDRGGILRMDLQEAVELPVRGLTLRGMVHMPSTAGRYPAVVLYHGFTGQKTEKNFLFVRLSRALAGAGFVCVRFDFSGSTGRRK